MGSGHIIIEYMYMHLELYLYIAKKNMVNQPDARRQSNFPSGVHTVAEKKTPLIVLYRELAMWMP